MEIDKIDQTCSNVYLIDEDWCIGNTLSVINYNTSMLSSALVTVQKNFSSWYSLYTVFSSNSARWLKFATNVQTYSASWVDMSSLVTNLSANWNQKFTLVYPYMVDVSNWNSNTKTLNNLNTVLNWVKSYFPASNYAESQLIDVNVYINQNKAFVFTFNETYMENCVPNGGGFTLTCEECKRPHRGCNHHGGLAGTKSCDNLYSYCTAVPETKPVKIAGTGIGKKLLKIGLNRTYYDKSIAFTYRIKLKNTNSTWVVI